MKYDATLKRLFVNPPQRLLSAALGREVVITRSLPTELITVSNLHPDTLFETADGELIHTELQGYRLEKFARRNLLYFALVLRDYDRPPIQIVFWLGPGKIAVGGGLSYPPSLEYQYHLIDLREIDGDWLMAAGDLEEAIFSILCRLRDERAAVAKILSRVSNLPIPRRREAIAELLILSGLRGLKTLVREEVNRMPISIDIHENEFLEEIYQEGVEKGVADGLQQGLDHGAASARTILRTVLELRFGSLPVAVLERINIATLPELEAISQRLASATSLEQLFS
ncbi:MAG: DUF4351 domain-containing protein [Bryobacteraceae bacterium]|nr:DUF4351 domain-containing protein [Bryobacteraceae bacterium]